ncbi:unnamed protein product [Spirodela intermedia]|uniref:Uncharacterized protein n=1 Tax=Spirodela intermedia TaxID=51605 RepID=A0A7I8IDE0_SPIIN|nr:unnamed protein product [Spirodela intermedia]CAA6655786.1 unnamed protein product [Spirodela intermedia]
MSPLADVLYRNAEDPVLAWRMFKHFLQSPSSIRSLRPLTAISRIVTRARMLPEIRELHRDLLALCSPETAYGALTVLAQASARSGLLDEAFSQLLSLRSHFSSTVPLVVQGNRPDLVELVYKDMLVSGISPETYTFNLLMLSLCESGRLAEARRLFDKMPTKGCAPNQFSFGILVRGYCRSGFSVKAAELLNMMGSFRCSPNQTIYNTLVSGFCREGKVDEAERLVERMRGEHLNPNVVTFNSRISALCKAGSVAEASKVFRDMQSDSELGLPRPNSATYNIMLDAFCKGGMIAEAAGLVEAMRRDGLFGKVETYNIWLSGLVRYGKLLEARALLSEMTQAGVGLDIYTYNTMIFGLCRDGLISDARSLMKVMRDREIKPDTVTYSTMLHAYCAQRKVSEASRVLHEMVRDGCPPNTFTCNILLRSLWREGRTEEAERLLRKMNEKGLETDKVTCNTVVDGLCKSGKVDVAMEIVGDMWLHGSASLGELGNMFLGMLSDAGNGEVIYESFIHGFCEHGKLSSAIKVLRDMEKGCHGPSVRAYNALIHSMGRKNQIAPDVFTYNSLISIFCEEGRETEAASLLDEMSNRGISPLISSLRCLIMAFCKLGNFEAALGSFRKGLFLCGGREDALYSLMCRELCAHGKLSEAKELFRAAVEKGIAIEHASYKYLIAELGYIFDPAAFMPVIDHLGKRGSKQEVDRLSALMMDMISLHDETSSILSHCRRGRNGLATWTSSEGKEFAQRRKQDGPHDADWQAILNKDEGSGIAMKILKQVQRGWGQGAIPRLNPPKGDSHRDWLDVI